VTAEIWFYELSREPVDAVLPGLLARHYKRADRVGVWCASAPMIEEMSRRLWEIEDVSFVPHGSDGDPSPDLHAIWFSLKGENANAARFRYCVEGQMPEEADGFERVSILFDGSNEAQRAMARERWKLFKANGHTVKYWKQNAENRWEDQAAKA
jgi:DNA polymerase III subunit chi